VSNGIQEHPRFNTITDMHDRKKLKVLFFDLNDPLDPTNWSGTPAQIFRCLQEAEVEVTAAGPYFRFIRKSINWIYYRYYRYTQQLFYHIERDLFWIRLFTDLGSRRMGFDADAVVTASPSFTSFVRPGLPIFMIHDATWGQVVESYPWFRRSHQPARIVEDGFELERIAYLRKDVFPVLTSEWAADRAVADYGVARERISILSLGPNLENPPAKSAVEDALQRRGTKPCRLLFIGKEWVRKGGAIAVNATAALIEMGVPAELHIVGPAEMGPGTAAAAALPSFVRSHGFLNKNVPDQWAILERMLFESDFFILPTQAEALGVVFAEAAAHGLPSIGTAVGGVPSVLHDGVGGAIFPPLNSARAMAEWIKRNYLDRAAYLALARRARRDYEERLSSLAYGTQLADIIRKTIEANRSREQSLPGSRISMAADVQLNDRKRLA
jgi:glycosyltransferase involved in cell wall biosynthesis